MLSGSTLPGTGVEVRQDKSDPKKLRVLMVAHSKLGGWLPQNLVNRALSSAISDIHVQYKPNIWPHGLDNYTELAQSV